MKRSYLLDWDALAALVAAVAVLALHLMKLLPESAMIEVLVVMLALLMVRDVRREGRDDRLLGSVEAMSTKLEKVGASLKGPDAMLIGPSRLREVSAHFMVTARGDVTFFNMCPAMFRTQSDFDRLMRPIVDNPHVASVAFIVDERHREQWLAEVGPKLDASEHAEKVQPPIFSQLGEGIAFILCETAEGATEALISFWGEPFMSQRSDRQLPRYMFHVHATSELPPRLAEMAREYRLAPPRSTPVPQPGEGRAHPARPSSPPARGRRPIG